MIAMMRRDKNARRSLQANAAPEHLARERLLVDTPSGGLGIAYVLGSAVVDSPVHATAYQAKNQPQ